MNVPANIQKRVSKIVDDCVAKAAKHFKRHYDTPAIRYDVKGATAGIAMDSKLVRFNPILLTENVETFLARTVPHEVAHCIDFANGDNNRIKPWNIFSGRKRPKRIIHGASWQAIMVVFGVDDIGRCHNYDVKNAQVKTKAKFEYKCPTCTKAYFLSSVTHNRVQKGQYRFCPPCGKVRGRLEYVGGLGKVTYTEAVQLAAERKVKLTGKQLSPNVPGADVLWDQLDAVTDRTKEVPVESLIPVLKPRKIHLKPRKIHKEGNLGIAQRIMAQSGYTFTRGQFIVRAIDAGLKATTASTYYNQLRRK